MLVWCTPVAAAKFSWHATWRILGTELTEINVTLRGVPGRALTVTVWYYCDCEGKGGSSASFSWEKGKAETVTVRAPGFGRVYAVAAADPSHVSPPRRKTFYEYLGDGRDRNGHPIQASETLDPRDGPAPSGAEMLSNSLRNFGILQQAIQASKTAGTAITVTLPDGQRCVVNANPPLGARRIVCLPN